MPEAVSGVIASPLQLPSSRPSSRGWPDPCTPHSQHSRAPALLPGRTIYYIGLAASPFGPSRPSLWRAHGALIFRPQKAHAAIAGRPLPRGATPSQIRKVDHGEGVAPRGKLLGLKVNELWRPVLGGRRRDELYKSSKLNLQS